MAYIQLKNDCNSKLRGHRIVLPDYRPTREYGAIESVFIACRFFLGLGQHAPVSAVRGGGGGHWNGTTTMQTNEGSS